jgi:uncharacterized protein DUF1570
MKHACAIFVFTALLCFIGASDSSAQQLRELRTDHYLIHTDLDLPFAEDLARRMDVMYDEYSRRLSDFTPRQNQKLFDVYLYQHRDDYLHYTSNRFVNTGGIFISGKALAAFLQGQGRDALRRTLQHEAFHQFAWNTIGPNLPVWLNEGLAQVFEEGIYDGRQFQIGQAPPRRIRQLQSDLDHHRLFEFRGFMAMTDEQWAKNLSDKDRGAAQYNQAWAMAHFLIFATSDLASTQAQPRFRSRLIDMLRLLHAGKSGNDAFVEAFSDNISGFEQMFLQYARQLQPTAEATYIEHQDVLADMLIELKSRGQTFSDVAAFRRQIERGQYQMEYSRGALHWNTEHNPHIYFCDLNGAEFGSDQLFFAVRGGAPLPDLVSRPTNALQLRTRFTQSSGGDIEHEILVEPSR